MVGRSFINQLRFVLPFLALGFAEIASAQLFEADTGSGKILEFSPTGAESTFVSGLSEPFGLAFNATGALFVSASSSGQILKFTRARVESTFASGLSKPWGLAFDASGNLFVAASGAGEILKFTPGGVKTTFASGLNQPLGLAFDSIGNLFVGNSTGVAGGGSILKFTPAGVKSTFATGLFSPSSLAFAASGNLYVADSGAAHIYKFTTAGVVTTFASGSTLGLAIDATGTIFSTDGVSSIDEFTPGGSESTFATGLSQPGLLAFTPFTTLLRFDSADGSGPSSGLIQATNGDFYGTTNAGGHNNDNGTVFKITPSGTLTLLYSFCANSGCADGAYPSSVLVQATDGNFYGTTNDGGAHGQGTVFKITPSGKLTTIYSFCPTTNCPDGTGPAAGLVQGTDGNLYGTTQVGGANVFYGTVFKITPGGTLTTLHSFDNTDGAYPVAALVQAGNGNFYGTTKGGGAPNAGTIFEITPGGTFTSLYTFCLKTGCPDGNYPLAALIQGVDGNLYGTNEGGIGGNSGTVFKMTTSGTLTTIYSFCALTGCTDGKFPYASLVQGTDGNLYGTNAEEGAHKVGTAFKITTSGTLTTLYPFCSKTSCTDGSNPEAALVQGTNGDFYGAAYYSSNNDGTIFRLSLGLDAFVETQTKSGAVGSPVTILGTNLTGATSVTFNGVVATFTVVSGSEITTTVPAGATTGKVQVVTPIGTLSSNKAFQVVP